MIKITGIKPRGSEVTLLTIMQIVTSMAGSLIIAMLRLPPDAAMPLTFIALVIGAHLYVAQMRKRVPERITLDHCKPLAIYTAGAHIGIGLLYIFVMPLPEGITRNAMLMAFLVLIPIAGGIAYGLTLWGLKRALRTMSPPAQD